MSPFAASMISSARHSWMAFLFLVEAWTTPVLKLRRAMSSLLWGEISTALGTEIPPNWSLVTSSRGAAFSSPSTRTWMGFFFVLAAMIL